MNEDHLKIENQLWKLMKYDIMQKLIDQMNPDQKNEIQELSEKLTKIDDALSNLQYEHQETYSEIMDIWDQVLESFHSRYSDDDIFELTEEGIEYLKKNRKLKLIKDNE